MLNIFTEYLFIHCCSSMLDIRCQSLCIVLVTFQNVKHVFCSWQIVFKLFYCSVFGVKIAFNAMSDILGHSRKSIITHELDAIQNQSFLIETNWWPTNWFRMFTIKLALDSAPCMLYSFSASLWVRLPNLLFADILQAFLWYSLYSNENLEFADACME